MTTAPLIVIAHNIRSTHNIGAIFRTCEGFGVEKLFLTGYSPYPTTVNDQRLPHIRDKLTTQISKTALGTETSVTFEHRESIEDLLEDLRHQNYEIVGLEQDDNSVLLPEYTAPGAVALLLGEEVHGITATLRDLCDDLIEIPMLGKKESFNVSVACGIALYGLRYQ